MKKNLFLIITFAFILVLLLVLLVVRKSFSIVSLESNELDSEITKSGAALLYPKKLNSSMRSKLKSYYKTYRVSAYNVLFDLEELNDYLKDYDMSASSEDVLILFMNGKPVEVVLASDDSRLTQLIEKHLYNIIPEDERSYKVLNTANQYIKKVNSKDYTVAVFGMNDCTYCDLYLLVINKIAKERTLDIFYFNRDEYDATEYETIMDLDFEIPAKCTTTGYSTTMKKSFPKPMTIITKDGEFVDCIKGYVTEDVVLDTFKQYKIVKE